ncbi:MAG: DUF4209 domain-containing protein [Candidatus Anammoxibacter sp.]
MLNEEVMLLQNIPLTKDDLNNSGWQEIIEKCNDKECHVYSAVFFEKAKEFENKKDHRNQEVFAILGGITSLMLKPESLSEPYQPVIVLKDSRSAIIDDFPNDIINFLSEILDDISDAEIRARIADVVWLRKRDYKAAEIAINSLIESATKLEDKENWTQFTDRIERALRLALQLWHKGNLFNKIITLIESILKKYDGNDPSFLSHKLMELLLETHEGDPTFYASLAERIAKRAEQEINYGRARHYWEVQAAWHKLTNDNNSERDALKNAAETYVKYAESADSNMVAFTHLQKAIEAYRRVGGHKGKIEELHRSLLDYQKKALTEMKTISSRAIDISDEIRKSVERVKGKSFHDALFELALMVPSPSVYELRKEVKESAEKHPIRHLTNRVKVNEQGKVTSKASNIFSNDQEEVEQAFRDNMFSQSICHHQISTQIIIEPVRKQITLEHNIRLHDFHPIVSNNPFVPQGREHLFALGLKAGIEGDFEISMHLLIPQIENSVRHLLTQSGQITSGINSNGIQDERSLNTTLYLPEIQNVFDENTLFDLQGLLVERFGANLRNLMAHGLMSHQSFYSAEIPYLWCLVLKLCCIPIIKEYKGTTKIK